MFGCAYVFPDFLCECILLQKITLNKGDFKNAFPRLSVLRSHGVGVAVLPSQPGSFKTRPTLEVCGLAPPGPVASMRSFLGPEPDPASRILLLPLRPHTGFFSTLGVGLVPRLGICLLR